MTATPIPTPRPTIDTKTQCVYCGIDLSYENMTVDHVIPKSRGGGESGNLAPCCKLCNILKGPLTAREFLAMRDEPEEMAAYKRRIEDELNLRGLARHRELARPLPAVPSKPPPAVTYAQRQAEEREKSQRARAMIKAGECVAALGFTCHCSVCDPKAHTGLNCFHEVQTRRLTQDLKDLAALRFAEEVTSREVRDA